MTTGRFEVVKQLIATLEAMPLANRPAFLETACAGDADLRAEVESLMLASLPSIMQTGGLAARIEATLTDDRAVGRMIGPYRLLEVLGEGGMGVVYRAVQTVPIEREVALKLVPLGMNTWRRCRSRRRQLSGGDRQIHPGVQAVGADLKPKDHGHN